MTASSRVLVAALTLSALTAIDAAANDEQSSDLPVVAEDRFDAGADAWRLLDPKSWRVGDDDGNPLLSQHVKKKSYDPPHRSPFHVALLKRPVVTDFDLTVKVRSTHKDYNHRDACLFFGYQDAAHFYYVHLGKRTDPHANQIFIVNQADRTKISIKTTKGTPWTDDWHTVRIVRRVEPGTIEVYFDDMKKPAMTAKDDTFVWGRVGVGSFDDTADFDDVVLRGVVPAPSVGHHDFPTTTGERLPRERTRGETTIEIAPEK